MKSHTRWAIHNHANHILDRSPIGITYWNVHVYYESAVQLADCSTDCTADCKSNMYIPVSHAMGDLSIIRLVWL